MTAVEQTRRQQPTGIPRAPEAPWASIVIPAHNEGGSILRCLEALVQNAPGPLQIVVAANGCDDDTGAVVTSFATRLKDGGLTLDRGTKEIHQLTEVHLLELSDASKTAALNAADDIATAYPRIYLDADVVLSPGTLTALIRDLDCDEVRFAAPRPRFTMEECGSGVRAFYRVHSSLSERSTGLAGRGVYGLSRQARARFGRFPGVRADDLYIARLPTPGEQVVTAGESIIQPPRDIDSLIRVRTRIALGNRELAAVGTETGGVGCPDLGRTTASTVRALVQMGLREPSRIGDIIVFCLVTIAARAKARFGDGARWHRDESSR